MGTEHCFHGTGFVLDMYPPIYSRRCCNCGYTQSTHPVWPKGHGPHADVEPRSEYGEPEQPCAAPGAQAAQEETHGTE